MRECFTSKGAGNTSSVSAAVGAARPAWLCITDRLVRGEVHQLDEGAANVQSNVAYIAGILMRQHYAWSVTVSVSYTVTPKGHGSGTYASMMAVV